MREGVSVACKSEQTDHGEYITDEDIMCELYLHRQQEENVEESQDKESNR